MNIECAQTSMFPVAPVHICVKRLRISAYKVYVSAHIDAEFVICFAVMHLTSPNFGPQD